MPRLFSIFFNISNPSIWNPIALIHVIDMITLFCFLLFVVLFVFVLCFSGVGGGGEGEGGEGGGGEVCG